MPPPRMTTRGRLISASQEAVGGRGVVRRRTGEHVGPGPRQEVPPAIRLGGSGEADDVDESTEPGRERAALAPEAGGLDQVRHEVTRIVVDGDRMSRTLLEQLRQVQVLSG